METIAKKIVQYLDKDETIWNNIDRMHMVLGIEVLLHNITMLGTILVVALIFRVFIDAVILLSAYGVLKMSAGGIHFKKSSSCLIGTGIFAGIGIIYPRYMDIELFLVILIYIICLIVFFIVGPQGTENNPISEENLIKMKKRTTHFILLYLTITVVWKYYTGDIPYLLFIATVFEILSILPLHIIKCFFNKFNTF